MRPFGDDHASTPNNRNVSILSAPRNLASVPRSGHSSVVTVVSLDIKRLVAQVRWILAGTRRPGACQSVAFAAGAAGFPVYAMMNPSRCGLLRLSTPISVAQRHRTLTLANRWGDQHPDDRVMELPSVEPIVLHSKVASLLRHQERSL